VSGEPKIGLWSAFQGAKDVTENLQRTVGHNGECSGNRLSARQLMASLQSAKQLQRGNLAGNGFVGTRSRRISLFIVLYLIFVHVIIKIIEN
jgi:hypothetical protein